MDAVVTPSRDAAVRRIDAVLAACAPARSPGTEATQAELSGVLIQLLIAPGGDTDVAAAAHLSERLAEARWAPHQAAAWLARTGIAVARPLIARSPALTDADLLALVTDGSHEHRLEVARRPRLSTRLTHALVTSGDALAAVVLLDNPSARIDAGDLDRLLERASREPALRAPLARRPELGREQAERLTAIVGASLRRRIQARFPDRWGGSSHADDVASGSDGDALVDKLARAGWLRPATLLVLLRRDGGVGFEAALARLAGASPAAVQHAVREPERRLPAVLAAAGVDLAASRDVVALVRACGRL